MFLAKASCLCVSVCCTHCTREYWCAIPLETHFFRYFVEGRRSICLHISPFIISSALICWTDGRAILTYFLLIATLAIRQYNIFYYTFFSRLKVMDSFRIVHTSIVSIQQVTNEYRLYASNNNNLMMILLLFSVQLFEKFNPNMINPMATKLNWMNWNRPILNNGLSRFIHINTQPYTHQACIWSADNEKWNDGN